MVSPLEKPGVAGQAREGEDGGGSSECQPCCPADSQVSINYKAYIIYISYNAGRSKNTKAGI